MKRNVINGILIAVMVALVAVTFSACNLVDAIIDNLKPPAPQVTSVEIAPSYGLKRGSDGNFIAVVGDEIALSAVVNTGAPENVEYKWYLTEDCNTTQIGADKALRYVFEQFSSKTYEIGVTANGVECAQKIIITLEYSNKILDSQLLSSTHQIIDGAIQEAIDNLSPVALYARWNKSALPSDAVVDIAWTVGDNPYVVCNDESYVFTPSAVGTYEIQLTLSYGESAVNHSVSIVVIEGYSAVASVDIVLTGGAEA
ncbi:MAG: hypothetical protein J6S32_02485, partial [Clostridia bacterium]|nr:hypothetical protein [Clostridia bacterium]